jgi:hypothetical protein
VRSFIDDTAAKTGKGRATVARSVARGATLAEIPNAPPRHQKARTKVPAEMRLLFQKGDPAEKTRDMDQNQNCITVADNRAAVFCQDVALVASYSDFLRSAQSYGLTRFLKSALVLHCYGAAAMPARARRKAFCRQASLHVRASERFGANASPQPSQMIASWWTLRRIRACALTTAR